MEEENKDTISKLQEEVKTAISNVLESGIQVSDLDVLGKLIDIYKDTKESENMNYGNYGNYGNYNGRRAGYDSYGEYGRDSYGRRGRDMKYRGDEEMDRMAGEYGRYMDSRSRYGVGEETDKSFHYMVKALEDFIRVLHEEVETPQQKQELMQALQNSMR